MDQVFSRNPLVFTHMSGVRIAMFRVCIHEQDERGIRFSRQVNSMLKHLQFVVCVLTLNAFTSKWQTKAERFRGPMYQNIGVLKNSVYFNMEQASLLKDVNLSVSYEQNNQVNIEQTVNTKWTLFFQLLYIRSPYYHISDLQWHNKPYLPELGI